MNTIGWELDLNAEAVWVASEVVTELKKLKLIGGDC